VASGKVKANLHPYWVECLAFRSCSESPYAA
jgi:hypothetical protein